jgi:chromate reductase, NAD(P)H dehydrogenase (quinone)
MNIVAFGASSSKNSINKKLANYVANQILNSKVQLLDLNDYEMPIYSIDKEQEFGIPIEAKSFVSELDKADVIIISFSEHNGTYTSAFKNIFDWASRVKLKMFEEKKLILLSTSQGPRGGQTVLDMAIDRFPRHGAEIIGSIALPVFKDNFSEENGVMNEEFNKKLNSVVSILHTDMVSNPVKVN